MKVSDWAMSPLKRGIDVAAAFCAIIVASPLMLAGALAVFLSDRRTPLYISQRVGVRGELFPLLKLRSMIVGAARSGVDTTVAADPRVTSIGRWLRRTKLDELPQLFNVLMGHMSLIGPRPNVPREVQRYTEAERRMLDVRPGLTDYASVVFADLADALPAGLDANLAYNQLVRPVKSRLALHYVETASLKSDLVLFFCTVAHILSRRYALRRLLTLLHETGADEDLVARSSRSSPLTPLAPPGARDIVGALKPEDSLTDH
jgi:lipopolysaccharide/colanic/teichoic acid biosynthesis glycosyltransferase